MSDAQIRVFVSHSKNDLDFALKLQASLQARHIEAWVDQRNLEGGQSFASEIQKAIERCNCVLVVVSPASMQSAWVQREVLTGDDLQKPIIPILLEQTNVFIALQGIQWIDFRGDYDQKLQDLQARIYQITSVQSERRPPPPRPRPAAPDVPPRQKTELPDLVPPAPEPPPPDPDLNALYQAGLEALAANDLERTASIWQQILDRDPHFRSGQVADDMAELRPRVQAMRVDTAVQQAQVAVREKRWRQAISAWQEVLHLDPTKSDAEQNLQSAMREYSLDQLRLGAWGQAIGAWQALAQRAPYDFQASEGLAAAKTNQEQHQRYVDALQYETANADVARMQLKRLYELAPYYGDPEGVAKRLGVPVPPSLEDTWKEAARRAREDHGPTYPSESGSTPDSGGIGGYGMATPAGYPPQPAQESRAAAAAGLDWNGGNITVMLVGVGELIAAFILGYSFDLPSVASLALVGLATLFMGVCSLWGEFKHGLTAAWLIFAGLLLVPPAFDVVRNSSGWEKVLLGVIPFILAVIILVVCLIACIIWAVAAEHWGWVLLLLGAASLFAYWLWWYFTGAAVSNPIYSFAGLPYSIPLAVAMVFAAVGPDADDTSANSTWRGQGFADAPLIRVGLVLLLLGAGELGANHWVTQSHFDAGPSASSTRTPASQAYVITVPTPALTNHDGLIITPSRYQDPLLASVHGQWYGLRYASFASDGFHINVTDPNPTGIWTCVPSFWQFRDGTVSVDATELSPGKEDGFGIVLAMQQQNDQDAYGFYLTQDGNWSFVKWTSVNGGDGVLSTLVDWTKATSAKTGLNEQNKMSVTRSGSSFTFSINDQVVGHASDATFGAGYMGLFVNSNNHVVFTNLVITTTG
jgi:tetratricopeptide (TPR) repeat protein